MLYNELFKSFLSQNPHFALAIANDVILANPESKNVS